MEKWLPLYMHLLQCSWLLKDFYCGICRYILIIQIGYATMINLAFFIQLAYSMCVHMLYWVEQEVRVIENTQYREGMRMSKEASV